MILRPMPNSHPAVSLDSAFAIMLDSAGYDSLKFLEQQCYLQCNSGRSLYVLFIRVNLQFFVFHHKVYLNNLKWKITL